MQLLLNLFLFFKTFSNFLQNSQVFSTEYVFAFACNRPGVPGRAVFRRLICIVFRKMITVPCVAYWLWVLLKQPLCMESLGSCSALCCIVVGSTLPCFTLNVGEETNVVRRDFSLRASYCHYKWPGWQATPNSSRLSKVKKRQMSSTLCREYQFIHI